MTDKHNQTIGNRMTADDSINLAFQSLAQGEDPRQVGNKFARQLRDNGYQPWEARVIGLAGYLPHLRESKGENSPYTEADWKAAVDDAYSSPPAAKSRERTITAGSTSPVQVESVTMSDSTKDDSVMPSSEFPPQKIRDVIAAGRKAKPMSQLSDDRRRRQELVLNLANVPEAMRRLHHWVLWCSEPDEKGKPTKVPYIARPGQSRASSTNPRTWRSFDDACAFFLEHGKNYSGLGFCFDDSGIAGIDFDNVLTEGGVVAPWADELITKFQTYCEVSPNGHGVHAYVFGQFEGAGKKKKFKDGTGFELYCHGRFFTVTGRELASSRSTINTYDCQNLADRFDRSKIGPTVDRLHELIDYPSAVFTPSANDKTLDLTAFLGRNPIEVLSGPTKKDGITFYEITCPWADGSHKNARDGRAFVGQLANGALIAGCLHETCSFTNMRGNRWDDLRHRYEPHMAASPRVDATSLAHSRPATTPETSLAAAADWSKPSGDGTLDLLSGYAPGDVGNGQRFLAMHRDHVLCDDRRGRVWHWWDGKRWQEVSDGFIRELAHQVGVEYVKQAVQWRSDNRDKEVAKAEEESVRKRAMSYLTTKGLNNAVTEAIPYVLAHVDDFDTKRGLLNLTNGTLDLNSDPPELRQHRREDRITRLIDFDYDPYAKCPQFLSWLTSTMGGNLPIPENEDEENKEQRERAALVAEQMVVYHQHEFGCTLSGDVTDKSIFTFNGDTDTGKTTLLQIIKGTIPDYSITIPVEVLMIDDRNSAVEETLFSLKGKLFAMTSETKRGQALNVPRCKMLTQGNNDSEIAIVPKYKPMVRFKPTHHIFVDSNFRPNVKGGDDATWNRLKISNFPHRIPKEKQNKHLSQELLTERQGIMAWMVKGWVLYRHNNFNLPEVEDMQTRLQSWRKETQPVIDFLEAHCCLESEWQDTDADGNRIDPPQGKNLHGEPNPWVVKQTDLWKSYADWFKAQQDADEKRLKKADFYGEIATLSGVQQGRHHFGSQKLDAFFGVVLR